MKCPNCGDYVYAEESIDSEYVDREYRDIVEGVCPCCHKVWRWAEIFDFVGIDDIEEVGE